MKPLKILIIDDDPDDQLFIKSAIKDISILIEVVTVFDGNQGLKYLEIAEDKPKNYHLPDLIICDINMPFVTGIRFLETVKKEESSKNIPVCILTTTLDTATKERLIGMGALDCFTKPVNPGNYKSIIASMVNKLPAFDNI